jgi:catechol 2,3-dioxygenase-like lactoylglutathione lyase family enzyme
VWDSFCWGITPWDTKKVEAELKKRGLTPIADHDAKNGFESFHVKDPGGFDLQISNGNSKNRRQKPAAGSVSVPAPFDSTAWKTVWLDHISFEVADYKASAAFYIALLGWKSGTDEGSQNQVQIGDVGDAIIRGGNALDPNFGRGRAGADGTPGPVVPPRATGIGHISFGITPFDPDDVKAELTKRGLNGREDTGATGDIHTAKYKSYHTTTPSGFDLQISNVSRETRGSL